MLSCIQPLPTLHFLCIIREHLACDCLPQSPSCLAEAMQRPKKTLISRSGQWLCEEKPSKVDSLYKDRLLHDDVRRGVTDFCHWAEDLFLEKIYAEEKNKSENIKAPKKLTQTERNPGSR
uniref:Family with sequence similarity 47, member E n=1 Tax=Mus spicilegus TaxID=10103 RepID=A0A8C6HNF6_MUSSI